MRIINSKFIFNSLVGRFNQFGLTNRLVAAIVICIAASGAHGQATQRAVFVANNGNLEGSVSCYVFNQDNSLHFVMKYVTGSTPSTSMPVHGTNAYSISITPSGK